MEVKQRNLDFSEDCSDAALTMLMVLVAKIIKLIKEDPKIGK